MNILPENKCKLQNKLREIVSIAHYYKFITLIMC